MVSLAAQLAVAYPLPVSEQSYPLHHRRLYRTLRHFGLRPPVRLSFRKRMTMHAYSGFAGANQVSRRLCLK